MFPVSNAELLFGDDKNQPMTGVRWLAEYLRPSQRLSDDRQASIHLLSLNSVCGA